MSSKNTRPAIGERTNLVYRECKHGCWCATGEAECAPVCRPHGLMMVPLNGDKTIETMQARRLGFDAVLGREVEIIAGIWGAANRTTYIDLNPPHGEVIDFEDTCPEWLGFRDVLENPPPAPVVIDGVRYIPVGRVESP